MKIWFGLVEAFKSYRGKKRKKKKITDGAQFNILIEFSLRADKNILTLPCGGLAYRIGLLLIPMKSIFFFHKSCICEENNIEKNAVLNCPNCMNTKVVLEILFYVAYSTVL